MSAPFGLIVNERLAVVSVTESALTLNTDGGSACVVKLLMSDAVSGVEPDELSATIL